MAVKNLMACESISVMDIGWCHKAIPANQVNQRDDVVLMSDDEKVGVKT
jgi:hypothetical protein